MRSYVINLPRDVDRRRHMEEQLRGFDVEFIEAVDGATVDLDGLEPQAWMTRPLIGDALSHLEAYRRILESGAAHGCVFEDDAVTTAATLTVLDKLGEVLDGSTVALLHYRAPGGVRLAAEPAIDLGDGRKLLEPAVAPGEPFPSTGTGYVVTAEACTRLLDLLPVVYGPDAWGDRLNAGALDRVVCVYPQVVHAEVRFPSTIGYGGRLAKFVPGPVREWRRRRIARELSRVEVV
jgi:glycosyl transferase, family 25